MPNTYSILLPLRLLGLIANSLFWFLPISLTILLRLTRLQETFVCLYYKFACLCFGLRVKVKGKVSRKRPLLLVSNHFSYLDVPALGSLLPVRFTPKSDVGTWPIIGLFCRMSRCIFIDRRVSSTKRNQGELIRAVEQKDLISLFPEGTTNEGKHLKPFRSSFFSLAEPPYHVPVQPISVCYTHINGRPMQDEWLPLVGWYADMTFFPHFLALLKLPSVSVEIWFHPVLKQEDRKALAAAAQQVITDAYHEQKKALEIHPRA